MAVLHVGEAIVVDRDWQLACGFESIPGVLVLCHEALLLRARLSDAAFLGLRKRRIC